MTKHKGGGQGASSQKGGQSAGSRNRRQRQQQQQSAPPVRVVSHEPEITKLDYAVANYLRKELPNKEANFVGIKNVNYFKGSRAVDLLMDSKWSDQNDPEAPFKSRHDIVIFLNDLLLKKFYHRATKIVKMRGTTRKFKLDMHDIQTFEDSNEIYVWLYEPTSLKAWLLSFGVIFSVIACCLFPLWPPITRTWVYYLCIAAGLFMASIFSLVVVRLIIFVFLWVLTFGKLQFWLLPNLTEDVGFFESFWPLYSIEKGVSSGNEGGGDGSDGNQDDNNNDSTISGGSECKQADSSMATSAGDATDASHAHQD